MDSLELEDVPSSRIDIEDIGQIDLEEEDMSMEEGSKTGNEKATPPVMDVENDLVLELPPLSDEEGFLDISDEFDVGDLDDIDFDFDDTDLSDLLLSDARRFEQVSKDEDARVRMFLIVSRAISYLASHMWGFFVPIALAMGFPGSIAPAAAYEVWIFICLIISSPSLAQLVEKSLRLDLINISVMGRAVFFVLSGVMLWLLLEIQNASGLVGNTLGSFAVVPSILIFSGFILSSSLMNLGFVSLQISVEQEWISSMYPVHGNSSLVSHLKTANMISQIVAPLITAPLFYLPSTWATFSIVLIVVFLLVPEYVALRIVVRMRRELSEGRSDSQWIARDLFPGNPLTCLFRTWNRLKNQILFLVIIANGLMSFWYLAYEMPMFLSFMTVKNVLPMWSGVFRSSTAIVSLLSTVVFPYIITRLGLVQSMRSCVVIASLLAIGSVPVMYFGHWLGYLLEILVLHAMITSYFCASKQMVKGLEIPIGHANQSLQNMFYLAMNLLGCILFLPKLFYVFAWVNTFCVLGATAAILLWGSKKSNVEFVTASSLPSDSFDDQEFN